MTDELCRMDAPAKNLFHDAHGLYTMNSTPPHIQKKIMLKKYI